MWTPSSERHKLFGGTPAMIECVCGRFTFIFYSEFFSRYALHARKGDRVPVRHGPDPGDPGHRRRWPQEDRYEFLKMYENATMSAIWGMAVSTLLPFISLTELGILAERGITPNIPSPWFLTVVLFVGFIPSCWYIAGGLFLRAREIGRMKRS